ncbi:SpoIIE family protein phosphatase [Blastococcus brunescens]|uniref:SpoIIE family protein phosphatase n=1 Tax=Blastococcus brunescens TaxID=1564165 RepID=A0ABZ1B557_9ACTN|nr:SpoIIE family protein phosphatase [Blastococcus sp. BMG 8361]WRL65921.1 SpoIIE family protein phosphatase [Blastococcus sp. BMG 8361]
MRSLTGAPGIPLGVLDDPARPEHHAAMPAEGTLLLFTDGLIERSDRDLDTGLAQLLAALEDGADLPLEQLCDRLLAEMLPADGAADDVALIAVRAYPEDAPRPSEAQTRPLADSHPSR